MGGGYIIRGPGGFKEHCAYEEQLKHELRAFLKTEAPKALNECGHRQFASQEALFDYIQKMHDTSLLEGSKKTMETQLLIRSKGYPTLHRFQEWQKVL